MQVIALTGLPRSGKDTVAAYLNAKYQWTPSAFAGPLKYAASIMLNLTPQQVNGLGFDREAVMPEWGFSCRHFLQYLGTEVARNFDPDFWVKRFAMEIANGKRMQTQGQLNPNINFDKLVITDCRFENEAKWTREQGGVVIEIRRPGIVANDHVSNKGVANPEFVIDNNGVGDGWDGVLHAQVDIIIAKLEGGAAPN